MEKVIIIGGGVGPLAGVELHKKIIEYTLTDSTRLVGLVISSWLVSPYYSI